MLIYSSFTETYFYLFIFREKLLHTLKIHSYITKNEKIKLYQLAKQRSGVFVEIGSYLGCSACFIATGMLKANNNSKLYCVDTWDNRATKEPKQDTFYEFLSNTKKFASSLVPIRNNSSYAAHEFNLKIDFLFIDADHSYEAVKNDVKLWFPKLNPNAMVIFHDIKSYPGVKKVVEEKVAPFTIQSGQLPNLWWGIFSATDFNKNQSCG